jgi:hypothetical protein
MVKIQEGYYTESFYEGDDVHYFVGGEPPLEQYILINGVWKPLVDGFYLMDKIIDGDPGVGDPTDEPPEGVPPHGRF